jgi:hypothetical protein
VRFSKWPGMVWAVGLVGLAVLAAGVPLPAGVIDRYYGRGLYPRLQPVLTALSNLTPLSWLDVLVVAVAGATLFSAWRVIRGPSGRRWQRFESGATVAIGGMAVLYIVFLAVWGFNYRRTPVRQDVDFDRKRVNLTAVKAFAEVAITQANHWRAELGTTGAPDRPNAEIARGLEKSLADVTTYLGRHAATPARPKVPLVTPYFNAIGLSGLTNPFGLETLIAGDLLPYERPMVIAHEWAHLAGVGLESEASFVGFVICQRGDAAARYSAWLEVVQRAVLACRLDDRPGLVYKLSPEVKADLLAARDRNRRDRVEWLSSGAWNLYDTYLKAHHVPDGVHSYDAVVALLVGTQFGQDWTPVRPRLELSVVGTGK